MRSSDMAGFTPLSPEQLEKVQPINRGALAAVKNSQNESLKIRPDDCFYYDEDDELDEYGFSIRGSEIDEEPEVSRKFIYGRRGYNDTNKPTLTAADIGKFGTPANPVDPAEFAKRVADFQFALKVAGCLKRAWEWPSHMKRFKANPAQYFMEENPPRGTVELTTVILARLFNIADQTVFEDLDNLSNAMPNGSTFNYSAEQVVLQMIQMIHGKYLRWSVGCK